MSKKIKFSTNNNGQAKRDKSSQAPTWREKEEVLFDQTVNRRGFLNLSALFAAGAAGGGLLLPNTVEAGTTSTSLSGTATNNLPTPDLWYKNSDLNSYSNGNSITSWVNSGSLGSNYNLVQYSGHSLPTRNDTEGYHDNSSNESSMGFYGDGTYRNYYDNDGTTNNFSTSSFSSTNQLGLRFGSPSSNDTSYSYWPGRSPSITNTTYSTYSAQMIITGISYSQRQRNTGWLFELQVFQSSLTDTEIALIRNDIGSRFTGTNANS